MTTLPTFQAQNPLISGCSAGWRWCTCFSGAMAAAYHLGVTRRMTGCQVGQMTHDTVGGTTLAQVDEALLEGWDVNLNTTYRLPWSTFAAAINAGKGAILQGGYAPIADSRFDAGRGFRGNHAVAVFPGWIVMDPLADGRYGEAYKFHGEAYPQSLLRTFAGKLNIGGSNYQELGPGLVYASLTRDMTKAYQVAVPPATSFVRYFVSGSGSTARVTGHESRRTRTGFHVACSPPQNVLTQSGRVRVSLVQIRKAGSSLDGWWVSSRWSEEV